jgi:D-beta-D-heptose 7-phosphate kinase/D-beta-D-heptose 1-phosphate adenosyltransferase
MHKILVIGDIMMDINYRCETHRKAPEANIPVYNVLETNYILGGAANVAKNLQRLSCEVEIISVIGVDDISKKMVSLIDKNKIVNKLFIDPNRKTTQKNRIILNNSIVTRYDIEDANEIDNDLSDDILRYIKSKQTIDAIIVSDYDKGVISRYLCENIIKYCNETNIYTFVDPKLKDCLKYKDCFCLKPNLNEGEIMSGEKNLSNIIRFIKENINCKNVVLTCGENGIYVNSEENHIMHNNKIAVTDVTGAGDIVASVLTYEYLQTNDLIMASKVANYIGGKSVQNLGNYCLSQNDICEYYESIEHSNKIIYDYQVDKIKRLSEKNNVVFTNGCFDILHSAHIKLLKFAKKQGDILVVGLNADNSIKRLKGPTRPINNVQERSTILAQFDFIDYIIIFEDDTPLNLLNILQPTVMVKGGDYKKDEIIGAEYADDVILFNFIENKSSSLVIKKITQNMNAQ